MQPAERRQTRFSVPRLTRVPQQSWRLNSLKFKGLLYTLTHYSIQTTTTSYRSLIEKGYQSQLSTNTQKRTPGSVVAMPPNDKAGRVVFIGNIPYGGTEELIVETLGRVGQVLNFRLVYDKETGRPKGFGFAEFADADAAASAVRNLNDYEVMGRKLRVDWSNDNGAGDNAPTSYAAPSAPIPMNGQPDPAAGAQSGALPPLPPGAELAPNVTVPDAISRTLSTLPPSQLLDILSQMKGLVMSDPGKAMSLLRGMYAMFQLRLCQSRSPRPPPCLATQVTGLTRLAIL